MAERLILEVEKHPELYDRSHPWHKNAERKIEIWGLIGASLATTGHEASKRWKDIRDAFVKSRRREIPKQSNRSCRPYKYAALLQFLLPCLKSLRNKRRATSTLENGEEDMATTDDTKPHKKAKRLKTKIALQEAIAVKEAFAAKEVIVAKDENTQELDEDDLFFRSMAHTCKKLPQNVKSFVRFKIHEIIFQAENQLIAVPEITQPATSEVHQITI